MSRDGIEYHTLSIIDGHDGMNHTKTEYRSIEPVQTSFIRLIPIVTRSMPVCIRTELFGCYRNDNLKFYLNHASTWYNSV